jgi:UDP-glucose 4-epimerase
MSTVAVTGCSGYVGRRLCGLLESDDAVARVVGVDVRDPAFSTRNLEFYRADVRSPDLAEILEGCDAVVRDVIVDGMRSVTAAARAAGAGKLVFTSTSDVYGGGAAVTEDAPLRPAGDYGAASAEAEEIARGFAFEQRDAVVTILRLPPVSGPSLPASPIVGPAHAAQALHESDAARALHHALTSNLPGTFNVTANGVAGGMSGERFRATGFAPQFSSADALRAGADASRGWVTVGGVRFRPVWVAAAAGSVAALAIGSAARAVRRART